MHISLISGINLAITTSFLFSEIAVSIRETEEKIKLSFRTNGKYNVSEVAANFGGGGHVAAAGAAVFGADLAEVEKKVIEVVGEILND